MNNYITRYIYIYNIYNYILNLITYVVNYYPVGKGLSILKDCCKQRPTLSFMKYFLLGKKGMFFNNTVQAQAFTHYVHFIILILPYFLD